MNKDHILVTGGAGFIGSNLCARLIRQGHSVVVLDNLSRPGADLNLQWLQQTFGPESFSFVQADVADFDKVLEAVAGVQRIYHLAGQVAVTTSVRNPVRDFADNAQGTFNVLEAARTAGDDPIVLYSSTNKVYGGMEALNVRQTPERYEYADLPHGIPETQPLDFHSPYGCSKGAGDQYTRDYARVFGLRSVVVRQSCIYGKRQFGIEDQGWIAWFMIAVLQKRSIVIYGNGKQVRDALYVEDLLDAYDAIVSNIDAAAGQIYNIGGGPENILSIWSDTGRILRELYGREIPVSYDDWRPGDQPIYVSDIRKAQRELGWTPKTGVREGLEELWNWLLENQSTLGRLTAGRVERIQQAELTGA